ncbi:MAG: ABC transporter substrate-binding protein [Alphaproteobacteria bacterium]
MLRILLSLSAIVSLLCSFDIQAGTRVIKFGQTAAIGGPAAELGLGMQAGIKAAFNEVNAAGGINGWTLELVTLDDGYEPKKAIANTKTLIADDTIFALIGGVGTPTANAIEPITTAAKVPFIAPFTGAQFLRSPYKRYVVNIRGSYWQETERWVEYAVDTLGYKDIAILYQDDSYGRAGLSGVERSLKKRGLDLAEEGTYMRNTTAVKMAFSKISRVNPEAIFMVGAYKPCGEFIKLVKSSKLNSTLISLSFVGTRALTDKLGKDGEGVIISQVVPFPYDSGSKLVKKYTAAMNLANEQSRIGFVSLEGYLSGRFVAEVLKKIPTTNLSREAFIDEVIKTGVYDLDGFKLNFGNQDNQGSNEVFLTQINSAGNIEPMQAQG